ncbi:MAG: Trk system potassium transporter TrkA [Deltaproteobacteria bacterium]|jgi:trk system potassium uptake protein TrkA|nr:Trk system potassium transporter TrkA [Deltaproteobacteria bacterium]MBW2543151.1 Trk system potassium transporter TrkA [Deltaproteobacteria bacterium]
MNIVIVGAGRVGQTLAGKLARDGHDVCLIEGNSAKVRALSETLDVQLIEGNGATAPVLRRAGIEKANLVVAVTDHDEANMVVGLLASFAFDVPRIVVRLRDADHAEGFDLIGQDHPGEHVWVNPDVAAVDRIASLLEVPGAVDVVSFMDGELIVAGFRIGARSDFVGVRVSDLNLLFAATPTLAVAIHRREEWIIPHGGEEIAIGDLVYFAIAREHLGDVLPLVGAPKDDRRTIMIAGAGPIGLELARRLDARGVRTVLIESDESLAQDASEQLSNVLVVKGYATDQSLLEEEDIDRVSTFVAVMRDHETNLVGGLLAKRLGAGRAVVLVDNPALVDLVGDIGIDAIISPRLLVIGLALQHIRGGRVRTVAQLLEDRIEIVEAEIGKRSMLAKGSLSEIKLPRGVLVAAIKRGDRLLVPRGADRAEAGDRVLLISTSENASKLADFLAE